MQSRYTGRFPITRIRGIQKRLPIPSKRVLKHSRYVMRALLVLKYLPSGTTATLKLLAFAVDRNV